MNEEEVLDRRSQVKKRERSDKVYSAMNEELPLHITLADAVNAKSEFSTDVVRPRDV
jgi:hypothetical protein